MHKLYVMQFIDTHCHIYSDAFDEDREKVLCDAFSKGISPIFLPAIDASSVPKMLELKEKYPEDIFLMTGLHPTYVKENYKEELQFVAAQLQTQQYCAVGEIGMDLYWDTTFLKQQQEAFDTQLQWAITHQLPVNIHCRNAFDETFEILENYKDKGLTGIFHCFTGDFNHAQKAIDCGLKLGIGGVVTFKNGKIDQFLGQIPLEHIVLETDAPYLAPSPYRGKRNEPAYLQYIAEKLAMIYNCSLEEISKVTSRNAMTTFKVIPIGL